MSTPCFVSVKDNDGKLYSSSVFKQSDGNPEQVLPFLEPFVREFSAERGVDPTYFIAQLLLHWSIAKPIPRKFCGWGIVKTYKRFDDHTYVVDLSNGTISHHL